MGFQDDQVSAGGSQRANLLAEDLAGLFGLNAAKGSQADAKWADRAGHQRGGASFIDGGVG